MAPVDPYAHVDADPYDGVIPGASPASAVAVSTLTLTAKEVLEGAFMPLWVRGEVSDFKAHRNGHWYFGLRDQDFLFPNQFQQRQEHANHLAATLASLD